MRSPRRSLPRSRTARAGEPASRPARGPGRRHLRRARCCCSSLLAATVIDLSWYWTNNLRMQRAADAGGAGRRRVPARPGRARPSPPPGPRPGRTATPTASAASSSRRSRIRPTIDACSVTITGPVGTFFARVVGITVVDGRADRQGRLRPARCRWAARRTTTAWASTRAACRPPNLIPGNTDWNDDRPVRLAAASGRTPTGRSPTTTSTRPRTPTSTSQVWTNFNLQTRDPERRRRSSSMASRCVCRTPG